MSKGIPKLGKRGGRKGHRKAVRGLKLPELLNQRDLQILDFQREYAEILKGVRK